MTDATDRLDLIELCPTCQGKGCNSCEFSGVRFHPKEEE